MGDVATIADKWMRDRLPRAMNALGLTAAAMVSTSIDTRYPPASKPDEPPHKRTGNLQAGISHAETVDGNDYLSIVKSQRAQGDPDVPAYLEWGTWKMAPRPFMRPVMLKADSFLPQVMARSFSSEATYATAG